MPLKHIYSTWGVGNANAGAKPCGAALQCEWGSNGQWKGPLGWGGKVVSGWNRKGRFLTPCLSRAARLCAHVGGDLKRPIGTAIASLWIRKETCIEETLVVPLVASGCRSPHFAPTTPPGDAEDRIGLTACCKSFVCLEWWQSLTTSREFVCSSIKLSE